LTVARQAQICENISNKVLTGDRQGFITQCMTTKLFIVKCKCSTIKAAIYDYLGNKDGAEFWAAANSWSPFKKCVACGCGFKMVQVIGKVSADHKCGAKCLASKGPSCTCSCGGKNHGNSYL
jgi:hypothetical protein